MIPQAHHLEDIERQVAREKAGNSQRDWTALHAAAKVAETGDWHQIWRETLRHPLTSGSIVLQAVSGVSVQAWKRAKKLFSPKHPEPVLFGRVRSVDSEIDGQFTYSVELAEKQGGVSHAMVQTNWKHEVGESVMFYTGRNGKPHRIYNTNPDTRHSPEGQTSVSLLRIASIVDAQYDRRKFVGDWNRVDITDEIRTQFPRYPVEKVGLYENKKTGGAIVVFDGTRPLSAADWAANLAMSHGRVPDEYAEAPNIAALFKQRYKDILIAGHSKGGGIAQYAGMYAHMRSVAINSPGVPDAMVKRMKDSLGLEEFDSRRSNISLVMVERDLVSNISGKYKPDGGFVGPLTLMTHGEQFHIAKEENVFMVPSKLAPWKVVSRHLIKNVCYALKNQDQWLYSPLASNSRQVNPGKHQSSLVAEPTTPGFLAVEGEPQLSR